VPDRDLVKRTKQFALEIIELSGLLPNDPRGWVLGKQILKSGTSIGANYNEAQRSRSRAEFNSKIHICQQELEETIYWLDLIAMAGLVPTAQVSPLSKEAQELRAIMTSISKSTGAG
jgi:four helix bundle protein